MKNWLAYLLYFVLFILYLVLVGLFIAIPDELTLNISLLSFNLALTLFVMILDRQRYYNIYTSGYFSKFVSSMITIFLVFCIFGMLNYLVFKNPKQLDLTEFKQNSLTEKSISITKDIHKLLTFKVFARKGEFRMISPILELYRNTNSIVAIEFIDVEIKPELVASYEIVKSPQVVIEHNGKREYVKDNTELAYTNGIIKVTRSKDPVIYFTTGHGELKFTDTSKGGISNLLEGLRKSNFIIKELDLKLQDSLPDDLSALVIWGPKNDFLANELKILDKYLANNSRVLVALDPNFKKDSLNDLRTLFKKHGISIHNDLVIDTVSHISGSSGTVPLIRKLDKEHVISKGITDNVFFPLVSSIEQNSAFKGTVTNIALSSPFPASWAEKNLEEVISGKVYYSETDTRGSVSVLSSFESLTPSGEKNKVAAIGNSSFVTNQYGKFVNNYLLVVNALAWLTDEGQLSSFNLPFAKNEPVFISAPQLGAIFYTVVIFIPIIFFATAIFWYRRRRKL